jgi:hypothetical protein
MIVDNGRANSIALRKPNAQVMPSRHRRNADPFSQPEEIVTFLSAVNPAKKL